MPPADSANKRRLTGLPTPRPGELLRALLGGGRSPSSDGSAGNPQFFNLARWALAAAVEGLAAGREWRLWAPAYICREAVEGLDPSLVRFYPQDPALQPDWDWLTAQPVRPGDILLLVHYFGFPGPVQQALDFCRPWGLRLIEDAAHCLGPEPGYRPQGDAAVFSPRKQLPLPDGGALVWRQEPPPARPGLPTGEDHFSRSSLLWSAKRLAQRYAPRPPGGRGGQTTAPAAPPPAGASRLSLGLWPAQARRLPRVRQLRRRNYTILAEALAGCPGVEALFSGLPPQAAPYLFPLLLGRRQKAVRARLRRLGVPAGSWPELPPAVTGDPSFRHAVETRDSLLTLPLHQGLGPGQLRWMAHELTQAVDTTD